MKITIEKVVDVDKKLCIVYAKKEDGKAIQICAPINCTAKAHIGDTVDYEYRNGRTRFTAISQPVAAEETPTEPVAAETVPVQSEDSGE